jgi:hypothetical protein
MGIEQVLSASASRPQRTFMERVIETIRRECVDQVIASLQFPERGTPVKGGRGGKQFRDSYKAIALSG